MTMICVSLQNKTARQVTEIASKVEMAEIRLDSCRMDDDRIEEIFGGDTPLVATCRIGQDISSQEAERVLSLAIKSGARYVDIESEMPVAPSRRLIRLSLQCGTTVIRSYHNFNDTPALDELKGIVDNLRGQGAQVVKIAVTANSREDVERVLSLYKYYTPESLIAFAMGQIGTSSRIECLKAGAPLSYACLSEGECTASGQMEYASMYALVYGGRTALRCSSPIKMPASKSYAQRAIIAAALSDGESTLGGYTGCLDSDAALAAAERLGAGVVKESDKKSGVTLKITGISAKPGCLACGKKFSAVQSALLARLLMPLGCVLCDGPVTIDGEGTLATRPLDGGADAIRVMGGKLIGGDPCGEGIKVPVQVCGPLRGGLSRIDGSKTSQIVSGALMAMPLLERCSTLSITSPTGIPYIYMTMDILRKAGIRMRSEMYGPRGAFCDDWSNCSEIVIKIKEKQHYHAFSIDIEGDWSAAAPFLAAGAIFGQVSLEGLDTTSLQADLSMIDLLMEAGASISQANEPTGTLTVTKAPLQAIEADLSNCPDIFPAAALLCAFCQGKSILSGVHRLRHKESDRADAIAEILTGLGVRHQIKNDAFIIFGESLCSRILAGRMLHGGKFSSHGDHRLVMALSLAGLGTDSPVEIDDTSCADKSFPEFNLVWNEYIRQNI